MSLTDVFARLPRNAETAFDVGAKKGDYAIEIAEYYSEAVVYAFEPAPANYAVLEERAHPRIVPVNAAVLRSPGTCELNLYDHAGSHSIFPTEEEWDEVRLMETVTVDAVSIDAFCEELEIPRIDFLKVDVEGAELEVLEGAIGLLENGCIGAAMVELMFYPYFEGQADPRHIVDFLRKYDMKMFYAFPVWWTGEPRYANAIFVKEED